MVKDPKNQFERYAAMVKEVNPDCKVGFALICPRTQLPCTHGCAPYLGVGHINDLTNESLLGEYCHWTAKIMRASAWGAALGAADSFRKQCASALRRRGLEIPT